MRMPADMESSTPLMTLAVKEPELYVLGKKTQSSDFNSCGVQLEKSKSIDKKNSRP